MFTKHLKHNGDDDETEKENEKSCDDMKERANVKTKLVLHQSWRTKQWRAFGISSNLGNSSYAGNDMKERANVKTKLVLDQS